MDKETVIGWWRDWVDKQESNEFVLNSDNQVVVDIVTGVLQNEEAKGFKYCPCKLSTGDNMKDIGLICPCNFKIQDTWKNKGECRCSLFVKDERGV